jgi:argininosuccinate synthase
MNTKSFDPGKSAYLANYVQQTGHKIEGDRCLLLYSGGLDTSCCLKYIQEEFGVQVVALTCDVGQSEDFKGIGQKAKKLGAEFIFEDARELFYKNYIRTGILMNATYGDAHPLASSLSRQAVVDCAAKIAAEQNIKVIAHGATGRGNDSFRFDNAILSRLPDVKILAPIRNNHLTREMEMDYAAEQGIPVTATKEKPYSIDENMWGREIEAGQLDNLQFELPNDVLAWVHIPPTATDAAKLSFAFEKGEPVCVKIASKETDIQFTNMVDAIVYLNSFLGEYGIGRHDYLEERASGFKVREVHESPSATLFLHAHKVLENATLTSLELKTKRELDATWAQCMVTGRIDPVVYGIEEFARFANRRVSGEVTFNVLPNHYYLAALNPRYGLDFRSVYKGDRKNFNQDLVAPTIDLMDLSSRRALQQHRQLQGNASPC